MKMTKCLMMVMVMMALPVFSAPCAQALPQLMLRETIDVDKSPFIGGENSPVTIIAFIDYQCPFCKQFESVVQQIADKYGKRIKLIFKNVPARAHEFAQDAALASLAASDQGKFWEFHVELFRNSPNLSKDVIQQIARRLRLDIVRFNNKMKSSEYLSLIKRDISEGFRIGITGTPTVYVNKKLLLDTTFMGLQKMIETELNR